MSTLQYITTLNGQDIYGYPISLGSIDNVQDQTTSYHVQGQDTEYNVSFKGALTQLHDIVIRFNNQHYVIPVESGFNDSTQAYDALTQANHSGGYDAVANEGFGRIGQTYRKSLSQAALSEQFAAAAAAKKENDKKKQVVPPSAHPVNLLAPAGSGVFVNPGKQNTDPDEDDFKPNWHLATAPAIGAATAGTMAIAAHGGPAFASLVGHQVAANVLSGALLAPAVSYAAAYGLTYMAARAQYRVQKGSWEIDEEDHQIIKQNSTNSAQQLAGCFVGAYLGHQVLERSVEAIMSAAGTQDASTKLLETFGTFSSNVAGLGTVELKGALMLFTALGLGLGLMGTIMYQNHRDGKPQNISQNLNAFFIGAAIGAAVSIGYGNEVARYLMPLATTAGLLMLMPHTGKVMEKAGDGLSKAGSTLSYWRKKQSLKSQYVLDQNQDDDLFKAAVDNSKMTI